MMHTYKKQGNNWIIVFGSSGATIGTITYSAEADAAARVSYLNGGSLQPVSSGAPSGFMAIVSS